MVRMLITTDDSLDDTKAYFKLNEMYHEQNEDF